MQMVENIQVYFVCHLHPCPETRCEEVYPALCKASNFVIVRIKI